jgi:peptide/nickel transport system substrate-binding protein
MAAATAIAGRVRAQATSSARVLRVVAPWDIRGLDPARGGFILQRLSIAETLVTVGPDGRFQPGLASSWQVSADGLTWRLPIAAGRQFHDGAPVDAAAAAGALEHARVATGSGLAPAPIATISAADGAVVIRLSRPFAVLPSYLSSYPAIILAPSAYGADGRVQRAIGSGPYRLTGLDGTLVMETEAVPSSDASVRRVQYRAVADGETRARLVEAGDVEIAFNLQAVAADRLRRSDRVRVLSTPIPRVRLIALNHALPALADLRVRQALSLAIDRPGAARALLRNPGAAADQLLPPFLQDWRDPEAAPLRSDPAAARLLLDDAGWHPGPDGVRACDGKRLAFELFTYAARPELPALAEAVQAQWRDIGVDARIRLGDGEEIPAMRASGKLETALVARSYGLVPDPIGTLAQDFLPPATNGYASVGWTSAPLEAAIRRYGAATDPAEQTTLRHRIASILQAELPVIPHSWYDQVVAVSGQVDGLAIDPFEASYGIPALRWATS